MSIAKVIAVVVSLVVPVMSCATRPHRDAAVEETTLRRERVASDDFLNAGRALMAAGRHLEASVYLEAALIDADNEVGVLAPLVISMVRSGRLEAVKPYLSRLARLAPEAPGVSALEALLGELTGQRGVRLSRRKK